MHIDEPMLADTRRFNRLLAWAPRLKVSNMIVPRIGQVLLRLVQIGADGRMRRRGLSVERIVVQADGLMVQVRVLRRAGPVRGVVLDIHGGGWVIGNPAMNDRLNADTVAACGVAVVSVDYRLATRATVGDMIDDCCVAARWLLAGALPEYAQLPVIVVGESAGAHLVVAALQRLRATPGLLARVAGAVMYYGVYDLAGTASVRNAGPDTLVLDGPAMLAGLRMLTPGMDDAARRHPAVSPLFGPLDGMPPALMVSGGRDPLRDDTLALAHRWRTVAEVELNLVPEAAHGFIHFPVQIGRAACAHTHRWINARLERCTDSVCVHAAADLDRPPA